MGIGCQNIIKKSDGPPVKGKRLPKLSEVLTDEKTVWQKVTVSNWYGQGSSQVEITSDTAIWYSPGKPVVPIRWILVRDPKGKFETKAFLCTDQSVEPIQILKWFIRRWQVEVTFQEVRAPLGVETQRQWSDKAIALVRSRIWHHWDFCMSPLEPDIQNSRTDLLIRLFKAVCYSS